MPDGTVNATEANRQFSRLLREVEDGGRITITKDRHPVAVLVPARNERRRA
ncbi:MAG TPA: type II toxin-antitoxin system prevent-host-death family antitoxin [Stellaceae bacterium]|nr:type II toxin-antitoxin system prevent-host-death family antitoxin [Stellaceae bacterium]